MRHGLQTALSVRRSDNRTRLTNKMNRCVSVAVLKVANNNTRPPAELRESKILLDGCGAVHSTQ